jgi:hypothetical protein
LPTMCRKYCDQVFGSWGRCPHFWIIFDIFRLRLIHGSCLSLYWYAYSSSVGT